MGVIFMIMLIFQLLRKLLKIYCVRKQFYTPFNCRYFLSACANKYDNAIDEVIKMENEYYEEICSQEMMCF